MRSFFVCFTVVASLIVSIACGSASNTPNVTTRPENRPQAATPASSQPAVAVNPVGPAKELFAAHCMICHKETGTGGKVTIQGKSLNAENLTSAKMAAKTDEQLTKYVVDGVPDEGMPAFKGKLTDEEIKLLVGHIRSLQGK